MARTRNRLIAGNWKMNGNDAALAEWIGAVGGAAVPDGCETVLCPPSVYLKPAAALAGGGPLRIGAQDCHAEASGAHTGDLSAEMIAEAGATHVIVGHSERRADHGESDAAVAAKASAGHRAGLTVIICIGESEAERDGGETLAVLAGQLAGSVPEGASADNTVIAYEPIWAIGTGRTPTLDEIAEAHAHIRATMAGAVGNGDDFRILYGGSMKPGNAGEILAIGDVDGGLIGGASLKAADFLAILDTCR